MKLISTYSIKIKEYRHIFKDTINIYRHAVDFFLMVCELEWEKVSDISTSKYRMTFIEQLTHRTTKNQNIIYDFDTGFYKFPFYLRRAAIYEALGKYSSYQSNLANWKRDPQGRKPSFPKAGYVYPCLYRDGMYVRSDEYTARIKVYVRNTWDWIDIKLKKGDVDYIRRRCSHRKECAPTLQKRGKEWFLDFPYEEQVTLNNTPAKEQVIAAVGGCSPLLRIRPIALASVSAGSTPGTPAAWPSMAADASSGASSLKRQTAPTAYASSRPGRSITAT